LWAVAVEKASMCLDWPAGLSKVPQVCCVHFRLWTSHSGAIHKMLLLVTSNLRAADWEELSV
jgi:hypothetical protein